MIEEKNQTANNEKAKLPKIFLILRFVALGLFVVGVTLIVLACTVLSTEEWHGTEPSFGCLIPGVLCVFFAIPCTFIGLMPSINKVAIKTSKYIQESNKEDLTDLMSTGMGIGINATSQAINENKDDIRNIADKGADIMSGPVETLSRSAGRGFREGYATADTMFCKHCGATIDRDSKFCSECGGQQ